MLGALIACGILLIVVGLFGVVRPRVLQRWVVGMESRRRYALAVAIRLALGVFLLAVAPEARWAGATRVLGYVVLAAALVVLLMGPRRLDAAVQWWTTKPLVALRFAAVAALAFGALMVMDAL